MYHCHHLQTPGAFASILKYIFLHVIIGENSKHDSFLQISPERCEPCASGGVNVSVSAVRPFRMNGAFRACVWYSLSSSLCCEKGVSFSMQNSTTILGIIEMRLRGISMIAAIVTVSAIAPSTSSWPATGHTLRISTSLRVTEIARRDIVFVIFSHPFWLKCAII